MLACSCCDQTMMPAAATACGLCGCTLCDDCRQPIARPDLDILRNAPTPHVPPDARGWLCPPCVASLRAQAVKLEATDVIDEVLDPHQHVT